MIGEADFWKVEKDATLLDRNNDFLGGADNAKVIDRAKALVDLIELRAGGLIEVELAPDCTDEAANRIFKLDAERTFKGEKHRATMVSVLQTIWKELQDYHQGVGFVVAFFLLLLPAKDVARIVIGLHRHYVPGYFKAAPAAYVRDARVFGKILEKKNSRLGRHLASLIAPEAFVSKWFIGMNVHVLTFDALLTFFEAFFEKGPDYLFRFGLALANNREADLLAADVSEALAVLRLDKASYPNDTKAGESDGDVSLFVKIVEESLEVTLDDVDFESMRGEVSEQMKVEEEKRKEREAELRNLSDDEITFSDEE